MQHIYHPQQQAPAPQPQVYQATYPHQPQSAAVPVQIVGVAPPTQQIQYVPIQQVQQAPQPFHHPQPVHQHQLPAPKKRAEVMGDRFKTKLCMKWLETGKCPYDALCMFAHGEHELRSTEMNLKEGLTNEESVWKYKKSGQQAANAPKPPSPAADELTSPQPPQSRDGSDSNVGPRSPVSEEELFVGRLVLDEDDTEGNGSLSMGFPVLDGVDEGASSVPLATRPPGTGNSNSINPASVNSSIRGELPGTPGSANSSAKASAGKAGNVATQRTQRRANPSTAPPSYSSARTAGHYVGPAPQAIYAPQPQLQTQPQPQTVAYVPVSMPAQQQGPGSAQPVMMLQAQPAPVQPVMLPGQQAVPTQMVPVSSYAPVVVGQPQQQLPSQAQQPMYYAPAPSTR